MNIDSLLTNALVFDLETYAEYQEGSWAGKEVNIQTNFEDYLLLAQVKWIGFYSFKNSKEYYLEVSKDKEKIKNILAEHSVLIGFNSEDFDYPILKNNNLISEGQWVTHIDCMKILGANTFKDRKGFKYKGRGELMNYKFKKNSLECMAKTMKLEFQKSTIDYKIFKKDVYTTPEKEEIIKYLRNDVMATKGLFDKLWNFWMPFTKLIDWKDVTNFSWIKSSIASLTYKSACFSLGTEATYSEHQGKKEEMGGKVLLPKYEEANNVWYVDFSSLYPHIFCMFNLFAEVPEGTKNAWHGNNLFQVKGFYDVSYHHKLAKTVKERLIERLTLKKQNPDEPMVYALKIFLNSLYGVARSPLFEKVHTENCGWDCCWIAQQITDFAEKELKNYGFESIYGDTDSRMILALTKKHCDRDYINICLQKIVKKILENVPFPVETFDIAIETFCDYMLFPFSEDPLVDEEVRKELLKKDVKGYKKEEQDGKKVIIDEATNEIVKKGRSWIKARRGKKKNYCYLYEKDGKLDIELVGLPIKKDNATPLGLKIYEEVLKPKILENKRAKFPEEFINKTLEKYLERKEIMELLAREFKVKPFSSYKISKGKTEPTGIHAQVSKGYFNGGDGVISLIKNRKVGNAGKTDKYCTIQQAIEAKLTINDIDLEKTQNELAPFIEYKENLTKKPKNGILKEKGK